MPGPRGATPAGRFDDVLPCSGAWRPTRSSAGNRGTAMHGPMPITRYPELEPSEIHAAASSAFDALGFPRVGRSQRARARRRRADADELASAAMRVTALDAYLPLDGRRRTCHDPARLARREGPGRGSRATGVRLVDGTEIRAGSVVLSAGTYGSPPILMRSGIGPADHLRSLGIEVRVDLPGVGRQPRRPLRASSSTPAGGARPGTADPILHSIATFQSSAAHGADPTRPACSGSPIRPAAEPAFYLDPVLLLPEVTRTGSACDRQTRRSGRASSSRGSGRPPTSIVWSRATGAASSSRTDPRSGCLCTEPAPPDPRRRRRNSVGSSSRTPIRSPTSSGRARWAPSPEARRRGRCPRTRPWRRQA